MQANPPLLTSGTSNSLLENAPASFLENAMVSIGLIGFEEERLQRRLAALIREDDSLVGVEASLWGKLLLESKEREKQADILLDRVRKILFSKGGKVCVIEI